MAKEVTAKTKAQKPQYEKILNLDDDKINVMLLGVSGCGKSTLINALLGEEKAKTGVGTAVTDTISVYEADDLPLRLIDTVGYEFGFFRQNKIKNDLAKFSKEGVKKADITKLIHMIWFCIDGTTKRIDQEVLKYIKSISNDWKNVPIIIVFTKSYSEKEIQENIVMAREAINTYNAGHKRSQLSIRHIIPVVAKAYQINDSMTVPTSGLDNLVSSSVALAPEAKKIAKDAIKEIDLKLKRNSANIILGAATAAASAIGAIDFTGIADAAILVPTQSLMLRQLSKAYGVGSNDQTQDIISTVMKVGATTIVGRTLIKALQAIPGLGVAVPVLNAAVAGVVTFALGEVSIGFFERIYAGEKLTDVEQLATDAFNKYLPGIINKLTEFTKGKDGKFTKEDIVEFLMSLVGTAGKKKE